MIPSNEELGRHFIFLHLTRAVRNGEGLQFCKEEFKAGNGALVIEILDKSISNKHIGFEAWMLERLIELRKNIDKFIILL